MPDNLIYILAVIVLACGLYMTLVSDNYFRKIIGLGVFQSAVLIFYIALGKVFSGVVPLLRAGASEHASLYSSPLPHVLMLTAIVVGFATLSVGLALIYRIYKEFGTISEEAVGLAMTSPLSGARGVQG